MVKKFTILILLLFSVFFLRLDAAANGNPTIDLQNGPSPLNTIYTWTYQSVENPIKESNPADCKPFAVGDLSSGNLSLQVGLPAFSQGVDVYLAIQSNVLGDGALFFIDQDYNFQIPSTTLPRWKTNNTAAINESLYGNFPISLLPPGLYNLYIAVVPTGETDFSHFYFWSANFLCDTLLRTGSFKLYYYDRYSGIDRDSWLNVTYGVYSSNILFYIDAYSYHVSSVVSEIHKAVTKGLLTSSFLGNNAFLEIQGKRYQLDSTLGLTLYSLQDDREGHEMVGGLLDVPNLKYIIELNADIDPSYTITLFPHRPETYASTNVQF